MNTFDWRVFLSFPRINRTQICLPDETSRLLNEIVGENTPVWEAFFSDPYGVAEVSTRLTFGANPQEAKVFDLTQKNRCVGTEFPVQAGYFALNGTYAGARLLLVVTNGNQPNKWMVWRYDPQHKSHVLVCEIDSIWINPQTNSFTESPPTKEMQGYTQIIDVRRIKDIITDLLKTPTTV